MIDTRVWMYRDGEAVCFASRKAVPEGEGWRETPAGEPARNPQSPAHNNSPQTRKPDSLETLRSRAATLGIRFHRNTGAAKLMQLIEEGEKHGAQS